MRHKTKKKGVDYNVDVPFEKKEPPVSTIPLTSKLASPPLR
jgi:hypothetical protein